jgi:hypothetical protein
MVRRLTASIADTSCAGGTLGRWERGRGETWVWKSITGKRARATWVSSTCSMLFGSNSVSGRPGRWSPPRCCCRLAGFAAPASAPPPLRAVPTRPVPAADNHPRLVHAAPRSAGACLSLIACPRVLGRFCTFALCRRVLGPACVCCSERAEKGNSVQPKNGPISGARPRNSLAASCRADESLSVRGARTRAAATSLIPCARGEDALRRTRRGQARRPRTAAPATTCHRSRSSAMSPASSPRSRAPVAISSNTSSRTPFRPPRSASRLRRSCLPARRRNASCQTWRRRARSGCSRWCRCPVRCSRG